MKLWLVVILVLVAPLLTECRSDNIPEAVITPAVSPVSDSSLFLSQYFFPTSIDPAKRYLFYLHGKIIEDQGIPAVSPDYGIKRQALG